MYLTYTNLVFRMLNQSEKSDPATCSAISFIAPDFPEYGSSDQPPGSILRYTFDHLVDVTDTFLNSLKLGPLQHLYSG